MRSSRPRQQRVGVNWVSLSRSVLRHRAEELGLPIRPDGFVAVDDLLRLRRFDGVTSATVEAIVAACPKRRFELRDIDGRQYVRATQGHSIAGITDEELLVKVDDPAALPVVVHGTYMKVWPLIKVPAAALPPLPPRARVGCVQSHARSCTCVCACVRCRWRA